MNLLKRTLLLMLALILPLQGVAGTSMSMCASTMGGAPEPAHVMHDNGMTCHHAGMSMDMTDHAAPQDPAPGGDCPHCFALSHFIVLPALTVPESMIVAARIPFMGVHFISLIHEQPIRPPVSA